jgi:uncharacterized protein (TIGR03067 family)
MRKLRGIGIVAAALVIASGMTTFAGQAKQDVKKELEQFQGKWTITAINNQEVPAGAGDFSLVFTGDKYQQISAGVVDEEGTFKVDASKTPMWMDLVILKGESAGVTQPGLATINGDSMILGFAMPGNTTRPANWDAAEIYATLRRVK